MRRLLKWLGYRIEYVSEWGTKSHRYDTVDVQAMRPIHPNMSVAPPWAKRKIVKIKESEMIGILILKNDKFGLPAWFVEHKGQHYLAVDELGYLATSEDDLVIGRDENKRVTFNVSKNELDTSGTHVGECIVSGFVS